MALHFRMNPSPFTISELDPKSSYGRWSPSTLLLFFLILAPLCVLLWAEAHFNFYLTLFDLGHDLWFSKDTVLVLFCILVPWTRLCQSQSTPSFFFHPLPLWIIWADGVPSRPSWFYAFFFFVRSRSRYLAAWKRPAERDTPWGAGWVLTIPPSLPLRFRPHCR